MQSLLKLFTTGLVLLQLGLTVIGSTPCEDVKGASCNSCSDPRAKVECRKTCGFCPMNCEDDPTVDCTNVDCSSQHHDCRRSCKLCVPCEDMHGTTCDQPDLLDLACNIIEIEDSYCRKSCNHCVSEWYEWMPWSCSNVSGCQWKRRRNCEIKNQNTSCQGVSEETKNCTGGRATCPEWSSWSSWNCECLPTNFLCVYVRKRSCSDLDNVQSCPGEDLEIRSFDPCQPTTTTTTTSTTPATTTTTADMSTTTNPTTTSSSAATTPLSVTSTMTSHSNPVSTSSVATTTLVPASWETWGSWQCQTYAINSQVSDCMMRRERNCSTGDVNDCDPTGKNYQYKPCSTTICNEATTTPGSQFTPNAQTTTIASTTAFVPTTTHGLHFTPRPTTTSSSTNVPTTTSTSTNVPTTTSTSTNVPTTTSTSTNVPTTTHGLHFTPRPTTTSTSTNVPTTTSTSTNVPTTTTTSYITTSASTATTAPSVPSATAMKVPTHPPTTNGPYHLPANKSIQCHVCLDPTQCENAHASTTCDPPNNYCINHIINENNGSRIVNRTCGNFDTCFNGYFTQGDPQCQMFTENSAFTINFQCTFCCVKDDCNVPLKPSDDTLYQDI